MRAVLDTNVLWGQYTRDLLLTLAERGAYAPIWSTRILTGLERHGASLRAQTLITAHGMEANEAHAMAQRYYERLLSEIERTFPQSRCDDYEALIARCDNAEHDRHVLALALRTDAAIIVTNNLKDFPPASLKPHGVRACSLDDFLSDPEGFDDEALSEAMSLMASRYRAPPLSSDDLMERLERSYGLARAAARLRLAAAR